MYSVSWDKSLKVWDACENKCLESVNKAHDDAVNAVVVSDDGTVYTGSADGAIRVWEKEEKERRHRLMHVLERHKSSVNALALKDTGDDGLVLFSGVPTVPLRCGEEMTAVIGWNFGRRCGVTEGPYCA